jgi:hypothetical protein
MKTARETWDSLVIVNANGEMVTEAIEARDAEWRRLVEEAQAETRRVNNEAQLRLAAVGTAAEEAQAERDGFKERCNAYERALHKSGVTIAQVATIAAERDRLKGELAEAIGALGDLNAGCVKLEGELAEARRLLRETPMAESAMRTTWHIQRDAFLAATPAEQAQAERENLTAQVRQLMAERDRLKGELAEALENIERMKTRYDEVVMEADVLETDRNKWKKQRVDVGIAYDLFRVNHKGQGCGRREEADSIPAEQAQGEGAKRYVACAGTCGRRVMVYPGEDPVWHCGNAHCQIRTAAPDGHHRSSREASMSPQTENYAEEVRMPVDSDAQRHNNGLLARVNALLDALTARLDRITSPPPPRPFVSEVKRHWDDPAVRDNFVDATLDDHGSRLRDLEWRFKAAHAVPPIAGGAKP